DEAAYILIFRIAVIWNRYAEREDILRIVTGMDALQRNEAADQQSRSDQEHERQSKLAYDENPARTVPAPVARTAGSVFQSVAQIQPQGLNRRDPSKQQRREHARAERECEHRAVDANIVQPRQTRRMELNQQTQPELRYKKAAEAAENCEQDALAHDLPNQPAARCSQRRTNRHFPFAPCGASKKKVGNVAAGNQQHEPDGGEKSDQRRLDVFHNIELHRHDANAQSRFFVNFIFVSQLLGDSIHFGLRLRHAGAWPEPPKYTEEGQVSRECGVINLLRYPEI